MCHAHFNAHKEITLQYHLHLSFDYSRFPCFIYYLYLLKVVLGKMYNIYMV